MLPYLAIAAREARTARDRTVTHIAAAADVGEVTIRRFERGQTWPRELDRILDAYAAEIGLGRFDLWDDAYRLRKLDQSRGAP
jgi:transcriptional regulator with XRE-family HTH domain